MKIIISAKATNNDLPVITKEEDAADSLATLLLIEYFEEGEEIVLTAADLFDLESDDIEEFQEEDFGMNTATMHKDITAPYAMCMTVAPKSMPILKKMQNLPTIEHNYMLMNMSNLFLAGQPY